MEARQPHATSRWERPTPASPGLDRGAGPAALRRESPGCRIGPRLHALALTVVLIVATLGIGWLAWSVVEWRRGRHPATGSSVCASSGARTGVGPAGRAAQYAGSAAPS